MARSTETTVRVKSVGGASIAHTLELSDSRAELCIQAGSHKLILGQTLPTIRAALIDLQEAAALLEQELDRRYPPALNQSPKLIEAAKPRAN